jgi:hypothetical protein
MDSWIWLHMTLISRVSCKTTLILPEKIQEAVKPLPDVPEAALA